MMKTYHIPAGHHYAPHLPRFYFGKNNFTIHFCFDKGCEYKIQGEDSADINKLFGVSFGQHHKNSIRIGWNSVGDGNINLYYYAYNNGNRSYSFIGTCKMYVEQTIKIELDFKRNVVQITNSVTGSEKSVRTKEIVFIYPNLKVGYYLYPYFGGNRTAPHDMYIDLKIE
jgi:hypothetical protein